ncbi:MAG: ADP-L-glycero-D-manno-heptose-6-epimerase [Candidatus Pacebacteria bacterium CG_4_10_14_0_2_um_filter_40_20]|nr:MAG: ADP-L-glycero-D-manno-heptose-6-epimerase [Candidatus Pacebacteria bacterium CG_4_10_14_0_2_um_filter_40_20]
MKKILVTGGAGFIGSHLCEKLIQQNHRVISLDNYSTGSKENHIKGVEYIAGDTIDISRLVTSPVNLVFHLGEYARVEQSFADIDKVLHSNTQGTQAVLEYIRKCDAKLVYAGSSTKFADGGIGRDQSPYAWTKATNTELVKNYSEWFGIKYAITYFYNVYGPHERGDSATGTLIGIYRDLYKKNLPLPVRLPGTQRRSFTNVEDIIAALLLVGYQGEGDEYGIGHPDSYSVLEVAQMFGGSITELPERPGNRMTSISDTNRTRLELGWQPKYNLPDYIKSITTDV